MKDNDNSVKTNAGKSNYDNANVLRSVSVVLRKMRLVKSLKHAENGGFMTKNIVFYKMMGRRTRGIAKILYGMNFCYNANATLIHAHHFIKTLLVLEKARFAVWRGALKIRVSLVRFRPRPPDTPRSFARSCGVFLFPKRKSHVAVNAVDTLRLRCCDFVEREIRPLLRDYIELLLLTGMRHGTEAMNICWQHIEWHTHKDVRYIRIWVDGKTGGRWLIAKHRAVDVLLRLQQRQADIKHLTLDTVLSTRVTHKIFRFSTGYPHTVLWARSGFAK